MIHYGERTDEFCDETIVIEECETMKDNLTKFVDDIANAPSTVMVGDVVDRWKIREAIEDAYEEGLRHGHQMTLGVGDGTGQLFVHGTYDSIKAVQRKFGEIDRLRTALQTIADYPGDSCVGHIARTALKEQEENEE